MQLLTKSVSPETFPTGKSASRPEARTAERKKALVLAGGGITGFLYEVGVLSALDELAGAPISTRGFDMYVGTSAGAVAASFLGNGASPGKIYKAIANSEEGSPFFFRPRDVLGVAGGHAWRLFGQFSKALLGSLGRALRSPRWPSAAQMLADFQAHHPPGFYSTEALEKTVCSRFTALGYGHQFSELQRQLYVTGTDIDSGEHLIFGDGDLKGVHICRAMAASCAIPVFFRPIRIEDRDVVDGAVSEMNPLDIAVAQGAGDILFIDPMVPIHNDRGRVCLPRYGGRCARLSEEGVGWIGEQAFRLMRAVNAEASLKCLLEQNPDLRIATIQPERHEMPMFMHNVMSFDANTELLAYGRQSGLRFFRETAWPPMRAVIANQT
jgi:NTE family protein